MTRMRKLSFQSPSIHHKFYSGGHKPYHRHAVLTLVTRRPLFLKHGSLPIQPTYTQITPLSSKSTVHVGTSYEHLCLQVLRRLGFSLTRTGGKSDKGIDLRGVWKPPRPSSTPALQVVVQCKAYTGRVDPAWVRELEGAVAGAPGVWQNDATVGVLCAPKGATEGIRDAMRKAEKGVVWVSVKELEVGKGNGEGKEEKEDGDAGVRTAGRVTQLLWNQKVGKTIAEGLGAGLRYVPGVKGMEQEVVLMLDGRVWEAEVEGAKHSSEVLVDGHGPVGNT